jgi:hypothetical protein
LVTPPETPEHVIPMADSPAIDAGFDLGILKDFAGTVVPQGAGPDIGPFEVPAIQSSDGNDGAETTADLSPTEGGSDDTSSGDSSGSVVSQEDTSGGSSEDGGTESFDTSDDAETTADSSPSVDAGGDEGYVVATSYSQRPEVEAPLNLRFGAQ